LGKNREEFLGKGAVRLFTVKAKASTTKDTKDTELLES
jgi:hypothetical protein